MRAAFAAREGDNISLGQLLPAVCRAEVEPASEDDQQLLALHVVVEDHLVARLELVGACAEMLRTGAFCDPHRPEPVALISSGSFRLLMRAAYAAPCAYASAFSATLTRLPA